MRNNDDLKSVIEQEIREEDAKSEGSIKGEQLKKLPLKWRLEHLKVGESTVTVLNNHLR